MTKQETITLTKATTEIQYMQGDIRELKDAVKALPDELISKLDNRYAKKEAVEEMQETLAPFTKFRRNVWYSIVFSILGIGLYIMVETKKVS